jgi:hypothetical protein
MSLYRRNKIWWSRIERDGVVTQCSTHCINRRDAEAFELECNGPSVRFWKQVDKNGPLPSEEAIRVWPEIRDTRCWPWTGGTCQGYGRTFFEGVPMNAQRVAWFLTKGVWPEDNSCHKCDNPPCCNPNHLFDATDAENVADMYAKGRDNPWGHRRAA